MIVSMSRFGTALSTRASGREAYDIVRVESRGFNQVMEFDFIGVSMVTNSFADELFGRMVMHLGMERMRALTTFRNVSPFWARIIRRAMDAHDSRKQLTKV